MRRLTFHLGESKLIRFRLRTLLIVLAIGPMVLAAAWHFGAPLVQDRFWPRPTPIVQDGGTAAFIEWQRSAKLNAAPQEP